MEDSSDCKIGNFQTEGNVIMLRKHSNKSVFESFLSSVNEYKTYQPIQVNIHTVW